MSRKHPARRSLVLSSHFYELPWQFTGMLAAGVTGRVGHYKVLLIASGAMTAEERSRPAPARFGAGAQRREFDLPGRAR